MIVLVFVIVLVVVRAALAACYSSRNDAHSRHLEPNREGKVRYAVPRVYTTSQVGVFCWSSPFTLCASALAPLSPLES